MIIEAGAEDLIDCVKMFAGKAVMYLYRHPRETKENKTISGRIIHNWARPIFHKEDNFAKLSKVWPRLSPVLEAGVTP